MDTSRIEFVQLEPSKLTHLDVASDGIFEWDDPHQRWIVRQKLPSVRSRAQEGLAAFEDLPLSAAAEIAQWSLIEILRDHTDDPADIALIERIERRLRPELFCDGDRKPDEAGS